MSTFDDIKKALVDLPISDILVARLDAAKEQSERWEKEVGELRTALGRLEAKLEAAEIARTKSETELTELKQRHSVQEVYLAGAKWKRGLITQNRWVPFCPNCDCTVVTQGNSGLKTAFVCMVPGCQWKHLENVPLANLFRQLDAPTLTDGSKPE